MHGKKKYNNKTRVSIQGLRPVAKSLPYGLRTILKRGGYNYSSLINNWTSLVGKKTSEICYPKNVKTNKELKDGELILNVSHGNQLDVEYSKKDIIEKINSFFGYKFIKNIKIVLINKKIISRNDKKNLKNINGKKFDEKINEIENFHFRKKLLNLANEFGKKKLK